jgi:threonine dehydratase
MTFSLQDIADTEVRLRPYVRRTPVIPWTSPTIEGLIGAESEIFLKLELFQVTGTFKARGAMTNALALSDEQRAAGLTAVSAGNHAVAVAFAAQAIGTSAKVVMIETANPFRVALCKYYGAEVVIAGDAAAAFARVEEIKEKEGRAFIHPFDGPLTTLGSATLGKEIAEQLPDLDALIVAIGGGGLPGGVARATKLINPRCQVLGVEPEGADNMRRSLDAGEPVKLERISTIADSLAPPYSLPYSFALCRDHLDDVVLVSDDEIRAAMKLLFAEAKLAVEPAAAAATAALCGPLRERLRGKRTGIIICGANIDLASFEKALGAGA